MSALNPSRDALFGKAIGVTLLSLTSPVTGFALELVLTRRYGNTAEMDAYRVIASILLIGTGILLTQLIPMVLVPAFSEARLHSGDRAAFWLAARVTTAATFLGALGWLASLFFRDGIVQVLGPGLRGEGERAAALFVPVMAGALVMVVFCASIAAILNCYGIFWTVPATTLLINLGIIAAVAYWPARPPVMPIRAGVIIGGLAGVVLHLACLWRVGTRALYGAAQAPLKVVSGASVSIDWKRLCGSAIPLIVTAACVHAFSVLVFRRLSEFANGTAVTYAFAFRMTGMVHLPAFALVAVVFPSLAEASAARDSDAFKRVVSGALRAVLFAALPCVAILGVIRKPLIALLLSHGAMSAAAIEQAGFLFLILLLGAPTGALIALLQRALVVRRSTYGVVAGAVAPLAMAALALSWTTDARGVAVLSTIACWINTFLLFGSLALADRRLIKLVSVSDLAKIATAGAAAAASAWTVSFLLGVLGIANLIVVTLSAAIACAATMAWSHLIRLDEATTVLDGAVARWRRAWSVG